MTRIKDFKREGDLTMAKIKKINNKLGAPSKSDKKNKNPFLRFNGSINLIEKFPGIDFMIYEKERLKSEKKEGE
jgi:hypothetical protein